MIFAFCLLTLFRKSFIIPSILFINRNKPTSNNDAPVLEKNLWLDIFNSGG